MVFEEVAPVALVELLLFTYLLFAYHLFVSHSGKTDLIAEDDDLMSA